MSRRTVSAVLIAMLLAGILTVTVSVQMVRAGGTIYIRADGSIDPPDAPISTVDNVTYTLTDNIFGSDAIIIERNNIIVDGAGYTLRGNGVGRGIDLSGRTNVTVQNMQIEGFNYDIWLSSSSYNSISRNNITESGLYGGGIGLYFSCSNNTVSENQIVNNTMGMDLYFADDNSIDENEISNNTWAGVNIRFSSNLSITRNLITENHNGLVSNTTSYDTIQENVLANNSAIGIMIGGCDYDFAHDNHIFNNSIAESDWCGLGLAQAENNTIEENNISNSNWGVWLSFSSNNNKFSHNDFMGNTIQAYIDPTYPPLATVWDDGYPSGGNYWSDYVGTDSYSGPYQNRTGSDGIGDSHYSIDVNNTDNYPLMKPRSAGPKTIIVPDDYPTIQAAINAASDGDTVFVRNGTYSGPLQINKTLTLLGENKNTTIVDGGDYISAFANNIRISEFTIQNLSCYVQIDGYDNLTFSDNIILNHYEGIQLMRTSGDVISNNNVNGNSSSLGGIGFDSVSDTIVRNNTITGSGSALHTGENSNYNNTFLENNIIGNNIGIDFLPTFNGSRFYHNNLINNNQQVRFSSAFGVNNWDASYPSGGNYWSDYAGADLFSGSHQNEAGSDGIGDTQYIIDSSNRDNYPLMRPYVPFENQTIYIRADGNVDPSGAPILRQGDYYSLTYNITSSANGIVIERDNITLDGASYTLRGAGTGTGFYLSNRFNITIQKAIIREFEDGIYLSNSQNNTIFGNNVTANHHDGILLEYSSSNSLVNNNSSANGDGIVGYDQDGIELRHCHYNNVVNNDLIANIYDDGIELWDCTFNNVVGNRIVGNTYGVWDSYSNSNNKIYHNCLIGNINNARIGTDVLDFWNDRYPFGGNYWSDYNGTDLYSGPSQNETGSDGIGDTPYAINVYNRDNYPLMSPYPTHGVAVAGVLAAPTIVCQGYGALIDVRLAGKGDYAETFNVTLYANMTDTGNVTVIQTFVNVTLNIRDSKMLAFMWDTTGFGLGNYVVSAYATPVTGEINTADNTLASNSIQIIARTTGSCGGRMPYMN